MHRPASSRNAESSRRPILESVEVFLRREPAKAAAAAFGVGLALQMIPPRPVCKAAANVTVRLLPSALLALGLLQSLKLWHGRNQTGKT
jgi:hypothetical protein